MPEATEVVDHAVLLATESLDALRRFVGGSSVVNDALGVLSSIVDTGDRVILIHRPLASGARCSLI